MQKNHDPPIDCCLFLCPRHSKNGGGALSVTPVRACVFPSVRYQNLVSITASNQFKFDMLIYNIKTQVKFYLGYNQLIFDRVMGLLWKHSTKIGVRSITFERLHRFHSYLACYQNTGRFGLQSTIFLWSYGPIKHSTLSGGIRVLWTLF